MVYSPQARRLVGVVAVDAFHGRPAEDDLVGDQEGVVHGRGRLAQASRVPRDKASTKCPLIRALYPIAPEVVTDGF